VDHPVHHFDIYATAAAAAGIPLPTDRIMDGVDLVPHATGARTDPPHRELFWRTGHYQVALIDGWKLQVNEGGSSSAWLFHLAEDPTEQVNLAAEHPDRVAAMREALARHNAEQIPSAWPSLVDMPINIDKTILEPDEVGDEYIYWAN
jgi:uncharacterized sulfatase